MPEYLSKEHRESKAVDWRNQEIEGQNTERKANKMRFWSMCFGRWFEFELLYPTVLAVVTILWHRRVTWRYEIVSLWHRGNSKTNPLVDTRFTLLTFQI